jgi:leucyl/phenylalanyl-tRNA--protein transferase
MRNRSASLEITPQLVLRAYACGIFPMAEDADDPALHWIEPNERGIIPLDEFHVPRRLARTVRSGHYTIRIDRNFDAVIAACAGVRADGDRTWINGQIRAIYRELFDLGYCHTVEVYAGETLVGGLYGLALGAAFFGESMFHVATDASKVALVHLVARLRCGGFQLLDAQVQTEHLAQFGTREISRRQYRVLLDSAIAEAADFLVWPKDAAIDADTVLAAVREPLAGR